jgi:DNA-binding response OmpR family regulator
MDGLALCQQLRDDGVDTPVLVLSALRDLPERVEGLDSGADDYLGKPFSFAELLARIRALTRRGERPVLPTLLRAGEVTLDQQSRRVTVRGTDVDLSPKEFALLELLLRNAGRVLSRDQIIERVWGYDAELEDTIVDLYVHYLRRKLASAGAQRVIETVRGAGYTIRART